MQCSRCGFVNPISQSICPKCGHVYTSILLHQPPQQITLKKLPDALDSQKLARLLEPRTSPEISASSPKWSLMRGDVLNRGRYRLVEEVILPRNQRNQGSAWLALDMQATRRRVLVHRLLFTESSSDKFHQVTDTLVKRFSGLAEFPGSPVLTDAFQERGVYYVVQQHPDGETLASLMQKQGGALPESDVAEYGRQLCNMLTMLAKQKPPLIHGSISPETIIVSSDKHQVALINLPLLPLSKSRQNDNTTTSYQAPEQARGGEAQLSSDLYSLAATMHHAVTGFDPRERMVFFYPPARRLNPLVTTEMEAILTRQLRFSTSQRYTTAEDMQKDLSILIASYPPLPIVPTISAAMASLQFSHIQEVNQRKQMRSRRSLIITAVSIIFLIAFLAVSAQLIFIHNAAVTNGDHVLPDQAALNQAALNNQLALELQSFHKKGIGISDGRLTFDTYQGRVDTNLKKQAATALQQGNMSAAVNLLNQAVNADPTDGEAQIYNEDIHIQQNNSPYITLALGMPIDGSATHLGSDREQLEAVYLAQHETNNKNLLPNGVKLRILIANSGANNADVATVAQFIANRASKDGNLDHLFGVIGWYNSSQTINARDIIASAHLTMIAPTASSVKLSGSSPYFFRVAPPDNLQGQILGTLLINQLGAKKVLILSDQTDSYSVSLADAVAVRIQTLGGTFTVGHFTENTTTVAQYQQIIANNAASATPDTAIFLAGFNVDGIRLAHAIGNIIRNNPTNIQLNQLKIVGGDAVDSGLLLGEGNSVDAQIALNYPQDMRKLIFTSFADFNEWNFLNVPQNKLPIFFNDWKTTYQSSLVSTNAPNPAYKGLMIYDAMGVYTYAATLVHGNITGDSIRKALTIIGSGKIAAYQGISGRITFDAQGNPVNKAVIILTIQAGLNGNKIVIQQVLGDFR